MSSREVTRCAVSIALLAVSAWVSIPLAPVPVTLQTLVLALVCTALTGREAVVSVAGYLLLGAVGLPLFSGMNGGLGVIAGPTGGYLWGFLVGMAVAKALAPLVEKHLNRAVADVCASVVLLLVAYALGTVQLVAVSGMGIVPALLAAVVPFIVPDAVKLAVGIGVGAAVRRALNALSGVAR